MDSTKQIHIKLPASLHKRLRVQSALQDKTIQSYVVEVLERSVPTYDSASSAVANREDV